MGVLVVGALGYVGQEVLKELRSKGIATQTCDVGWFVDAIVESDAHEAPDFTDFRDLTAQQLKSFDAIIHLAGYSNDPLGWLSEAATMDLNFRDAVAFATLAKSAGVGAFVFSSTCSVYGASGAEVLDEHGLVNPLTPYAVSKLATEQALLSLGDQRFRTASLRGATAFGRSATPRTDLLLNELCAKAAVGRVLQLTSNGKSWRPFMPVADFARALVFAALRAPQSGAVNGLWNIAPPAMRMTVQEASTRAAAVAGVGQPTYAAGSVVDDRSYNIDGSKFVRDYPDFTYSTDFEAAIRATLDGFAGLPDLERDLDEKRFIRLATLGRKALLAAE